MDTVTSSDGTRIAYQRSGTGPPLVILHGTGRDHRIWANCLPELSQRSTVYAVDRRGRGGSGDAADYAIEREVDDVLAVIQAVNTPVHLLGHSFGAIVALEAAMRADLLRSLILYEPPISVGENILAADLSDRLMALADRGDREALLETFLLEGPRYSPASIAEQRKRPDWPDRLAAAHTLARETHAVRQFTLDRVRVANLNVPVLLLLGSESPPFFQQAIEALGATLPDSNTVVLTGQHHNAMETAPKPFAEAIAEFFRAVSFRDRT